MLNRDLEFKPLRDFPELLQDAAAWFSQRWGLPAQLYFDSILECIQKKSTIPQWYVVWSQRREIVAGAGVIENDFHERTDLTPNLCALFVEPAYRNQGIARHVLDLIRKDMGDMGFSKVYLVTDHTSFYERCGWKFLSNVYGEDGVLERMYVAHTGSPSAAEGKRNGC